MRRGLWTARLLLGIVAQLAWLGSSWIFERLVAPRIESEIEAALGGRVRVRNARGSIWSDFAIDAIDLEGGDGIVREIRGLRLTSQHGLLALARDGLASITRVEARAESLHIDLDRLESERSEEEDGGAVDASVLRRLIPKLCVLRIDALRVTRAGHEVTVPLRARAERVPENDSDVELRVEVGASRARARIALEPGRTTHVRAMTPELAQWTRLWADRLTRGHARLDAHIDLLGDGGSRATLALSNARSAGAGFSGAPIVVDRAWARARWDARSMRIYVADADGPGLHLRARATQIPLDAPTREDFVRRIATSLRVDIAASSPWSTALPDGLRRQLEGFDVRSLTFALDCRDGRAQLGELRARGRGSRLRASSAPIDLLDAQSLRAGDVGSFDFELAFDEDARLERFPIGTVLISRGTARGRATLRGGKLRGEIEARVRTRAPDAGDAQWNGRVAFDVDDPFDLDPATLRRFELRPNLRGEGSMLGPSSPLRVRGAVTSDGSAVDAQLDARVRTRGPAQSAGRIALGARIPQIDALDASLRGSALKLRVQDFALDFLAPFLPASAFASPDDRARFAGTLNGSVDIDDAGVSVALRSMLRGLSSEAITCALRARGSGTDWKLEGFDMTSGTSRLRADGTLAGLDVRRALAQRARGEDALAIDAAATKITLRGDVQAPRLDALGLERVALPGASGALTARFEARGPLNDVALDIDARATDVACSLDSQRISGLSGRLLVERSAQLRLEDLRFRLGEHDFALRAKAARDGETLRLEDFAYEQDDREVARAKASARFPPLAALVDIVDIAPETLVAELELDGVDVARALAPFVAKPAGLAYLAPLRGALRLDPASNDSQLSGQLETEIRDPSRRDGVALAARARVFGDAKSLTLEDIELRVRDEELPALSGQAALQGTSLRELLGDLGALRGASLDASLRFADFDLGKLPRALGALQDLSGTCDGSVTARGPIAKPRLEVDVGVRDGEARIGDMPRISKFRGRIRGDDQELRLENVSASMGAAPLQMRGKLQPKAQEPWKSRVDIALTSKNALLWRRAGVRLRAGLDVTATGALDALEVAGEIRLREGKVVGRFPWFEFRRSGAMRNPGTISIPALASEASPVRGRLALTIETEEAIDVRTNVLRCGITTALKLEGKLSHPVLTGTAACVARGVDAPSLKLPGIQMRIATALVDFDRDRPRRPTLNVVANGRRHGHDVRLVVRGRSDRPEVLFSSNPPLPAEQLAVLVATGAKPAQLRRSGARGVGTIVGSYVVEELADYLFGSDSTEKRESFLERFTIESGTELSANGNESIVVSFRALPRLWLEGERDVYEDINFGVVYRVRFQ